MPPFTHAELPVYPHAAELGRYAAGALVSPSLLYALTFFYSAPMSTMSNDPSENTEVVATYPARHYAEMARDFLSDNGIDAFIVADDVHVPLQLTEGARLRVMESKVVEAYQALERAGLLPESIAEDNDSGEEEAED